MAMKRFVSILLALVLISGTALAQSGAGDLVQAAATFLAQPGNVTLRGEASFTYDGDCFKKLGAVYYREDDLNHYMDVDFWTSGRKGEYDSGYTVLAVDGLAQAWDKYDHYYERGVSYNERKTLLNEPSMELVIEMLEAFPELAGSLLDPYVSVRESDTGKVFSIELNGSALPEGLHAFVRDGIRSFLGRYFYVHLNEYPEAEMYHSMEYDFHELFSAVYLETYGEEMTDEYWERMSSRGKGTDEEWERYGFVYGKCLTIIGKAQQLYEDGFSLLHADGTLEHFETYGELERAMGYVNVYFEDYIEIVEDMRKAALESGQFTQADFEERTIYEIGEMLGAVDHYQEIGRANQAANVYVRKDGTYELYMDDQSYTLATAQSTVMAITGTMNRYDLGDVRMTVELDAEGRISSAEGTVELVMTDLENGKHSIQMTFAGNASEYGTTTLDAAKEQWKAYHDQPDEEQ